MTFWQNIVLKWKEIQQFCLWALPSDPSGLKESGLYYNTTANRVALRDDTKTQLLAHLEDTYKNAGVIKQPTITKGTNSITVGNDAVIRCYKTTDYSGIIQEIENPTGGTFTLAQNTPLWLVYTYGAGYSLVSSIPTGPLSNIVTVYRYFNAFGVIHSSTQDELAKGATEKMLVRIAKTEYFKRVGDVGVELSTSGLTAIISGGQVFNGPVDETLAAFNSSTNNLYQISYDDGVWAQTTRTTLNNTQYNPSTGLATLNSNKYVWAYVWRSVGDDVEAFYQLGEQEYSTEAQAIADLGKMPANIFGLYATHCVLVGYVLLKQGVTTTQCFSAWGRPSVAGTPVFHNTLSGIDGGDAVTPYNGHVKLVDNTRLNAAGAANGFALLGADGKLPSGQLPSYVDDVLEYATKANFPATGENGKIYVDLATNLTWRWSGSAYVEISPSLALGETSATAYRGDRGKTAYDHSQLTASNPHGTTAAQIAFTPVGGVAATDVQAAIAELDMEKAYNVHSHVISDVTGLQSALEGVVPFNYGYATSPGYWWNCMVFSVSRASGSYDEQGGVFSFVSFGGMSADAAKTCKIIIELKNQSGTVTHSVKMVDSSNDMPIRVLYYSSSDGNNYLHIIPYVSEYTGVTVYAHKNNGYFAKYPPGTVGSSYTYELMGVPSTTVITDGATLPAGAPIGKAVFVDGTQVDGSGALVNAPSGEGICRSGYRGTLSTMRIGAYCGCWFTKTTSSRWVAVGTL